MIEHTTALKQAPLGVKFEPRKHLDYSAPPQVVPMKDIGYAEDVGISPVAVSQPFQLFSREAVQQMRAEIFQPEVMANYSHSSNLAACQLRGYAPKHAPFAYDAWTSPQTLKIISDIAGIDLVPEMDLEIGHINMMVKTDEETKAELAAINNQKRFFEDDEGISGCPWEDDKPIVGWHTDSYPFVCVLMLSDCTNMVGGETALRTADGAILRVRGPQEGCAVILQGRYINHQALRALGVKERITSVTSFRPRSAAIKDDSVLTTVRPISDLSEIYYQFSEYRLEIMEERIRKERKDMMTRRRAGKKFDTMGHKNFLQESYGFLKHTDNEVVEDRKVIAGILPKVDYPDVEVRADDGKRPSKRARVE
jgi:hypothetical protein